MDFEDGFALPPPPPSSGPEDEDFEVEDRFDIDLAWLSPAYAQSVKLYIEEGLLPGRFAGGHLWTERIALEPWLNDIGHTSCRLGDPAYVRRIS